MAHTLPTELKVLVVQQCDDELERRRTLYSLALTNKEWSAVAVELIWKTIPMNISGHNCYQQLHMVASNRELAKSLQWVHIKKWDYSQSKLVSNVPTPELRDMVAAAKLLEMPQRSTRSSMSRHSTQTFLLQRLDNPAVAMMLILLFTSGLRNLDIDGRPDNIFMASSQHVQAWGEVLRSLPDLVQVSVFEMDLSQSELFLKCPKIQAIRLQSGSYTLSSDDPTLRVPINSSLRILELDNFTCDNSNTATTTSSQRIARLLERCDALTHVGIHPWFDVNTQTLLAAISQSPSSRTIRSLSLGAAHYGHEGPPCVGLLCHLVNLEELAIPFRALSASLQLPPMLRKSLPPRLHTLAITSLPRSVESTVRQVLSNQSGQTPVLSRVYLAMSDIRATYNYAKDPHYTPGWAPLDDQTIETNQDNLTLHCSDDRVTPHRPRSVNVFMLAHARFRTRVSGDDTNNGAEDLELYLCVPRPFDTRPSR